MVKLSIILVHYNRVKYLKTYLEQLSNQTFKDFEVIIIDNGSNFEEIMELRSFMENKDLSSKIFYHVNKGYASGINAGIGKALGDLILVSNIDIFFGPSFLNDAVKFMNNYDIMSPKIYYYPDMDKIWSSGGFFDFTNYRDQGLKNERIDEITEVDFVPGCAMFVRRDVFKKIKLFDRNFFMYFEDTDFCYRAKQMEFRVVYYPRIVVFHNITEEKEKQSELVKINYFKSKFLFIFKHYPLKLLMYSLPATVFIISVAFLKSKIKNRFIKCLKVIINGISLGLKTRFSL